ncbi:hypothetical protein MAPG_09769 [Magnaporthiopsis poae ATCC 64411]|uniref:Citrate transporter-like domain-containing protein n=1 Tax=Magnaporthiopsis poae (strain ATCC 64411 / 73-15) TaxID=644358 RepID=A0A0C4EAT9_MAGP6|nr:hypothetical protein MAPG_09769 [Magnaporthiopsis poae ATCC 64411]
MDANLDTEVIKEWRSVVTLVVFLVTNVIVLFPFDIPIFVPQRLEHAVLDVLAFLRVIQPRRQHGAPSPAQHGQVAGEASRDGGSTTKTGAFVRRSFRMNYLTAPIIADLFLLAIMAIGRQEVADGIIGTNHIHPYDIMLFFLSLAYIAISIDASGLIRYLAFKVLIWGGEVGHRLFFYLYAFFFSLGTFIGNDPIILSGTAFLAYMTRVSSNIKHPRAWIYSQFAVANIASATLVSSNPTNLVLAGAFSIRFIDYTANMVVPVFATAIVLFPFLLYIIFPDPALIPSKITLHSLPEAVMGRAPVNPNIPNARGDAHEAAALENNEQGKLLSLEEIMNPYLDKKSASFGGGLMTVTLVTLLSLNAAHTRGGQEQPVFYVTLPAGVVMLCWDLGYGWLHRKETREIAKNGRRDIEESRARRAEDRAAQELDDQSSSGSGTETNTIRLEPYAEQVQSSQSGVAHTHNQTTSDSSDEITTVPQAYAAVPHTPTAAADSSGKDGRTVRLQKLNSASSTVMQPAAQQQGVLHAGFNDGVADEKGVTEKEPNEAGNPAEAEPTADSEKQPDSDATPKKTTLASLVKDRYTWCQETFPSTMAVLAHLPLALVPFAFAMFVLVQGLVSSGWVPVFAYGWSRWVEKTGTMGAIGGMGFLSVTLCSFSGTNIGTTILLCRVVQAWTFIARTGQTHITQRTFWGTVYSIAIGVNYGAFSTAFSASLAGMLWRDILERKHIIVRGVDFARINVPIIAVSMIIGCVVLVGEIWITRDESSYI